MIPAGLAIEFTNVSKSFSRHRTHALLRQHVADWFHRGKENRFYALKHISFRLDHGESLAVIGANGAGKSTLLTLVAGLSRPDSGMISVLGRTAALLDLGSGFHPDLTGAENIRLNAALLGFSRARTRELFSDIVEFSEIGDFLHEPLRTYSTGMVMRLAFSVAINLDPDILIADEVLAVGDHAFQTKCFDKIRQFRDRGKTMLFVSHAPAMLKNMCDRAIWLDNGDLMMDGPLDKVLAAYHGRVTPGAAQSSSRT
jgi:ABC-type polysaccharide/polyol phosphate transport system ATPase subunit